jgi:hypothetical protein
MAHATTEDEHYEGYLIPKGTILFMNSCRYGNMICAHFTHFASGGINHDPDVYDHPEIFNPDRYLQKEYGTKQGVDESDFRHTLIFGAGRVSHIIVIHNKLLTFRSRIHRDFVLGWHSRTII